MARAVQFDSYGDIAVLHVAEVPIPVPADGEVVVRVRAGRKKRRADAGDPLAYVEQTVKAVADEARRLMDR